jgi:hypothetical protein
MENRRVRINRDKRIIRGLWGFTGVVSDPPRNCLWDSSEHEYLVKLDTPPECNRFLNSVWLTPSMYCTIPITQSRSTTILDWIYDGKRASKNFYVEVSDVAERTYTER